MQRSGVLAIGECMVEMAPAGDGHYAMGFAGDTFNTAWYLRRQMPATVPVRYLTAIGTDATSDRMVAFMADEGIDTTHVARLPGATVGLYMIHLDGAERSFSYWRSTSAARRLAEDANRMDEALGGADLAYLSGITLAILSPESRDRLIVSLIRAKAAGCRIAFDPNLRPALWSDAATMQAAVSRAAAMADIVLPSFDEDSLHFGDEGPEATLHRYLSLGAGLVVVKDGPRPVWAATDDAQWRHDPAPATHLVDTTAAGDSFNAGFLAAHLTGAAPDVAMQRGAALARHVIGARGALVPN